MVETIGTSTWPMRIGDHGTAGSGNFEWFLKGLIFEDWIPKLTGEYETGDDEAGATSFGQFAWTAFIKDVVIKTKTDMDKLKRAIRYWNDNDSELHFQNKLDGTDEGYWSNSGWTAADDRIKIMVPRVKWKLMIKDARIADVYIKRVT